MLINMITGADSDTICENTGEKCTAWVLNYLGDCLCNMQDWVSFVVGLASVICWGVAEVPQIITNFREGSTEGVSLVFLMTWVIGDVFNLVGCYLEPSTLPTQLYMAVLYTITTLVLVGQVIYYQHYLKYRKSRMVEKPSTPSLVDKAKQPTEAAPIPAQAITQPIAYAPSPPSSGQKRERYYMSARSLASSHTPTAGSYLAVGSRGSIGRGPSHPFLQNSNEEDGDASRPVPIHINTSRSAPGPINTGFSPSILRAVASIAMCVGGLNIGRDFMRKNHRHMLLKASTSPRVFSGRKLFQTELQLEFLHRTLEETSEETIGVWLGWVMAAIYMGGRLPQIWHNMRRGSVEGLNPLMFTFALLGNVTYVGSILIRSVEWDTIKSNMPWLVDAGVCVALDFLILCQFIFYCTPKEKGTKGDSDGDYKSLE